MGLFDIFRDAWNAAISLAFDAFNATIGALIRGLLSFIDTMIRNTPYPKCSMDPSCTGNPNAPLIFGDPEPIDGVAGSAIWDSLHSVYINEVQPYAYILWFLAVVAVAFSGTIEPLFPNGGPVDTEKAKQKLMVAFLGITLWWPLGVLLLAFSDAVADLLYGIGMGLSDEETQSIGLAAIYEIVQTRMEGHGSLGLGGLVIVSVLWLIEAIILFVLSLLWVIRYYFIFIWTPLMPFAIAVWAMEIPGFDKIQGVFGKIPEYFVTAVFLTIPGALLVGFSGQLINIIAGDVEQQTGEEVDTSPPGMTEAPDDPNALVQSPDDPVGSFSRSVSQDTAPVSEAAGSVADPGTGVYAIDNGGAAANPSMAETGSPFLGTLLFAVLALGIPIMAAASPFLMAKWGDGAESLGSLASLAGPQGAVVGGALKAAGSVDKAMSAKKGYSGAFGGGDAEGEGAEELAGAGDEHMGEGEGDSRVSGSNKSGFSGLKGGSGLVGRLKGAANSEKGLKGSLEGLKSAEGAGFLAAAGVAGASKAGGKTKGAAKTAGRFGLDVASNPATAKNVAKRSAQSITDEAVKPWLNDNVSKSAIQDSMANRVNSASSKISGAMQHGKQSVQLSTKMSDTAFRSKYEIDLRDEEDYSDEEALMKQLTGVADTRENVMAGMSEEAFYQAPDLRDTSNLAQYHGVSEDALHEMFDEDELEREMDRVLDEEMDEYMDEILDKEKFIAKAAQQRAPDMKHASKQDLEMALTAINGNMMADLSGMSGAEYDQQVEDKRLKNNLKMFGATAKGGGKPGLAFDDYVTGANNNR